MTRPRFAGPGRRAQATICVRCKQPVLRGLDEDSGALLATVDPYPLTRLGEVQATTVCALTYDFERATQRLYRRSAENIAQRPAQPAVVLVEHTCGGPGYDSYQINPATGRLWGADDDPPF